MLFIDFKAGNIADGVFVKLQKCFKKRSKSICEIKLAIFHEGWKQTCKNRYELSEKIVVCGIEQASKFNKRKEAVIAGKYNTDEIETRIFNSDGGSWIKKLHEYDDTVLFQLDPFHVRKVIRESNPGGECEKIVLKYLRENRIDEILEYIDALANSFKNEMTKEKVRQLYKYFSDNKAGLIPYQKRDVKLPELNAGLEYRNMGNCEHNLYLTIARRMKHRSACWSPQGSLNLCKLLCQKVSHTLSETLEKITRLELPDKFMEEIASRILSPAKIEQTVGKGYEGKHSSIPYENAAMTERRKIFRRIKFLSLIPRFI